MIDGGGPHNRLEQLRDPSHTRALAREELEDAIGAAGVVLSERRERDGEMPLGPWLKQSRTSDADAREIEAALRAELEGGVPTGLRPREDERGLTITQTWVLVGGRRGVTRVA
jgi:hypothetical protein